MSFRIINHKKTIVDYNKLKIFGYERGNLLYDMYDPQKLKYLYTHKHGNFTIPKNIKNREINFLTRNYEQSQIYSKLFKPNRINYTITGNFPKVDSTGDLQNFNIMLIRSNKEYKDNQLKFQVDMNYSKIEIKQILMKLYNINPLRITTAILPGRVKRDMNNTKKLSYIRIPDKKVAVVDIDGEVPIKLRQIKDGLKNKNTEEIEKSELNEHDFKEMTRRKIWRQNKQEIEDISTIKVFKNIPNNRKILFRLSEVTSPTYADSVTAEVAYFNKNIHLNRHNTKMNFIEEIENVASHKIAVNRINKIDKDVNLLKYVNLKKAYANNNRQKENNI